MTRRERFILFALAFTLAALIVGLVLRRLF